MAELLRQQTQEDFYLPPQEQITPEFLRHSEKKFQERLQELEETSLEFKNLTNTEPEEKERSIRLGFSKLPEVKNAIDAMLGLAEPNTLYQPRLKSDPRLVKASRRGTALHEALCIWSLWFNNEINEDAIKTHFPTLREEQITPVIEAFKNGDGKSIFQLWHELQDQEQVEEIYPDVTNLMLALTRFEANNQTRDQLIKSYSEVEGVYNIYDINKLVTNIQISLRIDLLEYFVTKNRPHIKVKDLKTGNPQLGDDERFQALVMHLLLEKLVNEFGNNRLSLPYKGSIYIFFHTFKERHKELPFELSYIFFDSSNEGNIKEVTVNIAPEERSFVLKRLGEYAKIALAFKPQIAELIRGGRTRLFPHQKVKQYALPILDEGLTVDLSNLSPTIKRTKKKEKLICPLRGKCDRSMTRECDSILFPTEEGAGRCKTYGRTFH